MLLVVMFVMFVLVSTFSAQREKARSIVIIYSLPPSLCLVLCVISEESVANGLPLVIC